MPPKKDKQWQFVGNEVRDVHDLTMDHIRAIYGLGPLNRTGTNRNSVNAKATGNNTKSAYPYCSNRYKDSPSGSPLLVKGKAGNCCTSARCKDGNPHCLNYMGQEQWENEDAFDRFFATLCKKMDPGLSKRKPNSPAGMKNLGATCYANSLLQVWFHDLPFRDAIYRARFRIDADKALVRKRWERYGLDAFVWIILSLIIPDTLLLQDALYQLQYLFAHLDCGTKDTYNPLSLVSSLKLDTNMQQDAQEFCNLFMALIDSHLQTQEDIFLRSFIRDQFQGHYSYITTCKKCETSSVRDCTFYELMLNIKENCILMDCFDEFVEDEDLVGSDRYLCSHCDSLQDATRKIKLDSLPKVLNIQLMRFVYDATTWTKKKSKDMIRFPLTIDVADLLGSQSAVLYDLSAVLVHSGPSAHSGHFMAHVLDKVSNKWFVLNDEEVTEFDSTLFDPEDYAATGSKSKAKKTTMKAGAPDSERLLNTLSSRNAYMLTYTRRTSEPMVTPRKPPSETLDLVALDNDVFDSELKEYIELVKFEQAREVRRNVYHCWAVKNDEDAKQLLAEQGVEIDPVLTPKDVCPPCTRDLFQDKLYDIMHRQDIERLGQAKKKPSSPSVWISKSWLTTWKKVSPDFHRPHTSTTADPSPLSEPYLHDVLCPHSNLGTDESTRVDINMACLEKLVEIFGPMELPEKGTSKCQECQELQQPPVAEELIATATSEKNERPVMLDNADLLCKHHLFLFDFNTAVDKKNNGSIAVIKEDEWSFLKAMYEGGPDIVITKQEFMETGGGFDESDSFSNVQSTPAFCPECREERLTVRIYNPGESVVDDKAPPTPASTDVSHTPTPTNEGPFAKATVNAKSKRKQAPASAAMGARRSKRVKEGKKPYNEYEIPFVGKNSTIMEHTGIVPLYQKLLYEQIELDDNEKTVAELALPPNAVLSVLTFDQDMDDLDLDKFHDDTPAPGDVGGFGGTGLTENWF
ncbi:hypothetical protein BGZ97_001156 [Linnemannia gamsii]|uniref:Ubiquitin carboxyl-terminal hydrolase n=1 Tax=Linnemannia gamsii TaxID=64522 RepID=A0A9P6UJN1_9FUNG|nr:hypothetical protein BGZ97_001156 [Linnemannia gamsii]